MADWHFDVAIIGSQASGKSSMVKALLEEEFSSEYRSTLGAERATVEGLANGQTVQVSFTCLPGARRLLPLTQLHLKKKHAAIVTYSVESVESFKETAFWVNEVMRMSPSCLIVLVGTFAEGKAKVNGADALVQAKEWAGRAYTISSKTGRGIADFKSAFFRDLVKEKGHIT